jgi:hypothetical protein
MQNVTYQFSRQLPAAVLAEISRLQDDGYVIHQEWANGVELRKGKPFRVWLLVLQCVFPYFVFPGYMRLFVDNVYGYKFRLFVTLDPDEPKVLLV